MGTALKKISHYTITQAFFFSCCGNTGDNGDNSVNGVILLSFAKGVEYYTFLLLLPVLVSIKFFSGVKKVL